MSKQITVSNVGPVPTLVVPVQPGGTVIKGYCGKGKSIVLEAIGLGLGARERGRVSPRAGTKRGEVDCLGVVLGINASRITRNGESSVVSVEEFSVGDLIDPPVKDDEARNRHGIKALLRLSGAEADPARFYHLAGGKAQFEALVPGDALKSTDLVDMAAKVKRSMEARARDEEAKAEHEEGKAAADRNAGDGLNLKACTDPAKLQKRLEEASLTKGTLDEQARAARTAKMSADEARRKLAAAGGDGSGLSREQSQIRRQEWAKTCEDRKAECDRLKAELQLAMSAHGMACIEYKGACEAEDAIDLNEQLHAGWQAAIDAAADVWEPSTEDLTQVASAVQAARVALENAAVVRAAKERIAKAKAHQEAAAEHRKAAGRLREAAKGTDDVLSQAVASSRYSVEEGVLLGKVPGNGEGKPYYDLSDGERTMIACAEKIERARAVESDGERLALVDLPQRVYQDLPPSVRRDLFAMAEAANVCVVTAEVDDGELRAEVYEP